MTDREKLIKLINIMCEVVWCKGFVSMDPNLATVYKKLIKVQAKLEVMIDDE